MNLASFDRDQAMSRCQSFALSPSGHDLHRAESLWDA
jgi:hypothetical protein